MGLKFESGLWVKTILSLGSEYLMERTNTRSIQITTIEIPADPHEEQKSQTSVKIIARSKANATKEGHC